MPYITPECADRIKESADILKIVGFFVQLEKRGSSFVGLSPFTAERTPSFYVTPAKQMYKCFSSGKGGDAIHFLMELNGMSYPEALEWIAKENGQSVEYDNSEKAQRYQQDQAEAAELRRVANIALDHYMTALEQLPKEHPAWAEMAKRGYDQSLALAYGIGYAPGRGSLARTLGAATGAAALKAQAREIGLLKDDEKDFFNNRLVYAIRDKAGALVGLAGRDLGGFQKSPKWLNPQDSKLYKKEGLLYGLDKARSHIANTREVVLVEGYNDVIAFQTNGLPNTVGTSGTAITLQQIVQLRKLATKVILCMDPDSAGHKATLKAIPDFLREGMVVMILQLQTFNPMKEVDGNEPLKKLDPDEFCRIYRDKVQRQGLASMIAEDGVLQDGFKYLVEQSYSGTVSDKSLALKDLVGVLASIKDDFLREAYSGMLVKMTDATKGVITNFLKQAKEEQAKTEKEKAKQEKPDRKTPTYILPEGVDGELKEYLDDIQEYGLFQANNQIWVQVGEDAPYYFKSVSNFSIEIIQHMFDEKLPMKLVRICNVHGQRKIFDVPSDRLNKVESFDNAVTAHGNYFYNGGRADFQRLRKMLFERMGIGKKVEVLGWNSSAKLWFWNNLVSDPVQGNFPIDKNGVFKREEESYYIPSANHIYQDNDFKYTPQKKVIVLNSQVSFFEYTSKLREVHREHAINATLFTVATMFLDIIEDRLGNFPLLFLYGPPSTGKDQLIEGCQSFFGLPQSPIHIGNKVSTAKAQIRKFAQFRNMVVHLSEYRPGDQQLDELLKGFWDRRGYERGTIESAYGTETVPINSSVIFTGNHYPYDDALISRIIPEEVVKSDFNEAEKKAYAQLKDMYKNGVSSITLDLLRNRKLFEDEFKGFFRSCEATFRDKWGHRVTQDRILQNMAVLGATFKLLENRIEWPFKWDDFMSHNQMVIIQQMAKMTSASTTQKWWDCFLACVRTTNNPLEAGRDFNVDTNLLTLRFSLVYNRVSAQWWAQFNEQAPRKATIQDMLRKDDAWHSYLNGHRMPDGSNSSAYVFDSKKIPIINDLSEAVEWQKERQKRRIETPEGFLGEDTQGKPKEFPF